MSGTKLPEIPPEASAPMARKILEYFPLGFHWDQRRRERHLPPGNCSEVVNFSLESILSIREVAAYGR